MGCYGRGGHGGGGFSTLSTGEARTRFDDISRTVGVGLPSLELVTALGGLARHGGERVLVAALAALFELLLSRLLLREFVALPLLRQEHLLLRLLRQELLLEGVGVWDARVLGFFCRGSRGERLLSRMADRVVTATRDTFDERTTLPRAESRADGTMRLGGEALGLMPSSFAFRAIFLSFRWCCFTRCSLRYLRFSVWRFDFPSAAMK